MTLKYFACFLLFFMTAITKAQVPVMNSILGPAAVCSQPAQASTFSTSASNSPTSYSWSTVPASSVVISTTMGVASISFPNTNSTYTVYCSATNGSGTSNTTSFVVTVFETPTVTFSGATIFCQGSGTNLSASPTIISASSTLSYSWSPSVGLNSTTLPNVFANPPTTTTYTVLLTIGNCTNNAMVTVNVVGNPTISAMALPANVCAGQPSTLTLNGSGLTYSVFNNPVTNPTVVNPMVTTNFIIGTTGMNGCKSFTQVPVTVMSGPVLGVVTSPQNICSGQNATLTINGNALNFVLNGSPIPGNVAVVSPVLPTGYTVSAMAVNGCTAQTTTFVNVMPAPSISGAATPPSICEGQTAMLMVNGNGVTNLLNGNPVGMFTTLSPTVSTVYTLSTISVNGCTNSSTIMLPVIPNPTITVSSNPAVICKGEKAVISLNGNALSYTVNTLSSPPNFTVNPASTHTYNITGEGLNNCKSQTQFVLTVEKCTGIQSNKKTEVSLTVFPNPNTGSFNITTNSDMDAVIFNNLGQAVRSLHLRHGSENLVDGLTPGVYILTSGSYKTRIIITE